MTSGSGTAELASPGRAPAAVILGVTTARAASTAARSSGVAESSGSIWRPFGSTPTPVPNPPSPAARAPAGGVAVEAELGAADDVAAVRVLVDVRRQAGERAPVVLGAVLLVEPPVLAVVEDLLRARPGARGERREDAQNADDGGGGAAHRSPCLAGGSGASSAASIPSAHADGVSAATSRAPWRPSARRRSGSCARRLSAAASRSASPCGTTSPECSWRTRPPATAPTASVAMTGRPRCRASLATSAHGSRKSRVAIDGMTRTLAASMELRTSSADATRSAPRISRRPPSIAARSPRLAQDRQALLGSVAADEERGERPVVAPLRHAGAPRSPGPRPAGRRGRGGRRGRARRR